ncbi:MAG: hypothetical protein ACOX3T_02345 [Bdellovibrionota bacterium]
MAKLLLFIISLFSVSLNASSTENECKFLKFIDNLTVVNKEFETIKKVPNLEREFKSSGVVKFIKNKGFIWKEQSPRNIIFISTKTRYCSKVITKDGTVEEKNALLKDLPYFSEISSLIDNILLKDYEMLHRAFSVNYTEKKVPSSWALTLIPNANKMKKFISQIKVVGDEKKIESINVNYENGISITLKFYDAKVMLNDEIKC